MDNIQRVKRVSQIMKFCCGLAVPAVPAVLALMWLNFDLWGPTHPDLAHLRPLSDPMPTVALWLGFACSMIPGGLVMFAGLRLRTLFASYARGAIFTRANARCLRDFALSIILFAFAKPVAGALLSVVLTYSNPPGQRHLAIQLSSADLTTLFVGCVFLVIAWIMQEGERIAEEHSQIV